MACCDHFIEYSYFLSPSETLHAYLEFHYQIMVQFGNPFYTMWQFLLHVGLCILFLCEWQHVEFLKGIYLGRNGGILLTSAPFNRSSGAASFIGGGMMSGDVFDVKILTNKLSKLNTSQQSIESLSHWCITHQKKARQIVETWEKVLNTSQKEQCVSFLFLANDILQNSRRKGTEFVNEFWKILPGALKNIHECGDENARKAVYRLVFIWEERKVFGSRLQNLKDELLGRDPTVQLASNGKSSNPIKIVKKDAQSLRIKLNVGGFLEKIVTTFHSVHDENPNEEDALANCNAAIPLVERIDKDVDDGTAKDSTILNQLQEQENILQQCVKQLESAEASRVALVTALKAAIHEQKTKLDIIHHQLQVARSGIEIVRKIKQKLSAPQISLDTSFAALAATEEENKKAAAAAVVAKLTASSSSAMMLTSVLSSLVAEEAAARKNGNMGNAGFIPSLPQFSPEKRQKLESNGFNSETGFVAYHHQSMPVLPPVPTSIQPMSPATQMPASLPQVAHLPPIPPAIPPASSTANQFQQSAGMILGPISYGYTGGSLPPPPPMQSQVAMNLARPPHPHAQQLQLSLQPQQQQPGSGGYYGSPGFGTYAQSRPPAITPAHRQGSSNI